ncbi:replication factor C subunit 1 [Enteropsectra breve]|nr:replication factor C subunit 1 [Enteropsectra breve]
MTSKLPLENYVFVFTGEMEMPREEAKNSVMLLGARTTTAISGKTTHLVCGAEPGEAKLKKAKELKLTVLSEQVFAKMLSESMDKASSIEMVKNEVSESCDKTELREYATSDDIEFTDSQEIKADQKQSWADKYRPQCPKDFIGNATILEELRSFLSGRSDKKAALLSGSPGVGKTTAAHMIAREKNYEIVEFNASDLRSKSSLAETVGKNLQSSILDTKGKKRLLIMDEVDGMTSDRGGIPELTKLIKATKQPIICICNDRNHAKMRTLANYCADLRFRKLDARIILPKLKEILHKEGHVVADGLLNALIVSCGGDMRYILNMLQGILKNKRLTLETATKSFIKKTALKSGFELAAELFHTKPISEKTDIYFEDYSLNPLFVQENYIKCMLDAPSLQNAADAVSYSDVIDRLIHGSEQEWSLMPHHAFYSCIYPTHFKPLHSRIDFPMYLGQLSSRNKHENRLHDFASHCSIKHEKHEIRLNLLEIIIKKFNRHLEEGAVDKAIEIVVKYNLSKEDMMNAMEIIHEEQGFKKIPTKLKSLFTKEYKKLQRAGLDSQAAVADENDD